MTGVREHWTLGVIPWGDFDPTAVDPEIVPIIKAASLVEYNGGSYADYLCRVFHDDIPFQEASRGWADEEVQHGLALARWAELADTSYDFERSFKRFSEEIRLPAMMDSSVRGSRSGELIARCMVEVGTSSYYCALGEATDEPVLKAICRHIAADELRHYKLFYTHLKRYLEIEDLGFWRRLRVALGRIGETEDDELAYAYYAANAPREAYDRRRYNREYVWRAYSYYQPHHVERGIAMVFKVVGLKPYGRLCHWIARLSYRLINLRAQRLAAAGS